VGDNRLGGKCGICGVGGRFLRISAGVMLSSKKNGGLLGLGRGEGGQNGRVRLKRIQPEGVGWLKKEGGGAGRWIRGAGGAGSSLDYRSTIES